MLLHACLITLSVHLGAAVYHGVVEGPAMMKINKESAQAYALAFRPRQILAPLAGIGGLLLTLHGWNGGGYACYVAAATEIVSHFAITATMIPSIVSMRTHDVSEVEFRDAVSRYFRLHMGRTVGVALSIAILLLGERLK